MLTAGAHADPRRSCPHATPAALGYARASRAGSGFVPSSVDTDQPGARFRGRDLLRTVAEGTAGAVGDEFLRGLVRHVALAFDAKFAFVAEADDPTGQHVRVVSGWYAGGWMDEPFEYDTGGKPCARRGAGGRRVPGGADEAASPLRSRRSTWASRATSRSACAPPTAPISVTSP